MLGFSAMEYREMAPIRTARRGPVVWERDADRFGKPRHTLVRGQTTTGRGTAEFS